MKSDLTQFSQSKSKFKLSLTLMIISLIWLVWQGWMGDEIVIPAAILAAFFFFTVRAAHSMDAAQDNLLLARCKVRTHR